MINANNKERREFIKWTTISAFGLLFGAGGYGLSYLQGDQSFKLRPPGAVKESDFLSLCIKCGQCLQVCPYHSILLDDINTINGVGTPYINARERGCYLCNALPCVLACPSGALSHDVEKPEQVDMGIAVLKHVNKCLAANGDKVKKEHIDRIYAHPHTREVEEKVLEELEKFVDKECTICADMCPYPNPLSAIGMVSYKNNKIPEVRSNCVGCGVCEELCPAQEEAAIVIEPRVTYEQRYKKEV